MWETFLSKIKSGLENFVPKRTKKISYVRGSTLRTFYVYGERSLQEVSHYSGHNKWKNVVNKFNLSWENKLLMSNPKYVYKILNKNLKSAKCIPNLRDENKFLIHDKDKANKLMREFQQVFTNDDGKLPKIQNLFPPVDIVPDFTGLNVSKYLRKVKIKSSAGHDGFSGINYIILLVFCSQKCFLYHLAVVYYIQTGN